MSATPLLSDLQRIYDQVRLLYSLLTPEQKQQYVQLQRERTQA